MSQSLHTSSPWSITYATLRDTLLQRIVSTLIAGDRFVAAWLTGSLGRGTGDAYSDIDLVAVVALHYMEELCARPWQSAGRTTPERLTLLQQWGVPVIVHETHRNAPEGGTHTNVLYEDGTRLDLNLVPFDLAQRPPDSRLLFEQRAIPLAPLPPPETLVQRREMAAQTVALFWIMIETAAKYRQRHWDVSVHLIFDMLHGQVARVRRLIAGEPPRFQRHAPSILLATTPDAQATAIRALCDEMEALLPDVAQLGADVPAPPRAQVEYWLNA